MSFGRICVHAQYHYSVSLSNSRPTGCECRCCTGCGKVLESLIFSTETTFTKGADGSSQAQGNFVSDSFAGRGGRGLSSYDSNSHEQSLARGKQVLLACNVFYRRILAFVRGKRAPLFVEITSLHSVSFEQFVTSLFCLRETFEKHVNVRKRIFRRRQIFQGKANT